LSIAILRHGVRVGDTPARVPVEPRVPQQRHGSARTAHDGGGPDGEPRGPRRSIRAVRQEAAAHMGEIADASRLCPHVPAAWRHAERVSGSTPGGTRPYSYANWLCGAVVGGGASARACGVTQWHTGSIPTNKNCSRMSEDTARLGICTASSWDTIARSPLCRSTLLQVRQRVEQLPNGVQQRPGRYRFHPIAQQAIAGLL
jgi:hypothetical protein